MVSVRAQMLFHIFNNPIGICIVPNESIMLVYELSDHINHIRMH